MSEDPQKALHLLVAELRESVLALPGVGGMGIDVTTKPPGTIEWE